jgi:hypothetical protein
MSSFSYCNEDVSIETFVQNFLKFIGKSFDRKIVKFGSGAGHKLYSVCKNLNEVLVTLCFQLVTDEAPWSSNIHHIDSVVHVGSQAKSWL